MGRIRTIKPEFPHSESMGRVSRNARLLFILLFTIADDSGRLRGNSRMLASLLYPYDDDAGNLIEDWIADLESQGCVRRYQVNGLTYIEICNWLIHQKIDKPSQSKIPPFVEPSRGFDESSRSLPVGSKEGIRTKEGKGIKTTGTKAPETSQPETETLIDEDFEPDGFHLELAGKRGVDLEFERDRFVDTHLGKETLARNWNAMFTTWLLDARP